MSWLMQVSEGSHPLLDIGVLTSEEGLDAFTYYFKADRKDSAKWTSKGAVLVITAEVDDDADVPSNAQLRWRAETKLITASNTSSAVESVVDGCPGIDDGTTLPFLTEGDDQAPASTTASTTVTATAPATPSTGECDLGPSLCAHQDDSPATWILEGTGLGLVGFTDLLQGALPSLRARFGEADSDAPVEFCPSGAISRTIEWADLVVFVGEADGADRVVGWVYGPPSAGGKPSLNLRTEEGIGIGSTVADLRAAYGTALTISSGDGADGAPETGPSFLVEGSNAGGDWPGLGGGLTGTAPTDTVMGLSAGAYCGE
jgi:hypothetical protein